MTTESTITDNSEKHEYSEFKPFTVCYAISKTLIISQEMIREIFQNSKSIDLSLSIDMNTEVRHIMALNAEHAMRLAHDEEYPLPDTLIFNPLFVFEGTVQNVFPLMQLIKDKNGDQVG